MKRSLAITAATAMLALSLAGCGAERNGDIDLLPDLDGTNDAGGTTATDTMRNNGAANGTGMTGGATANTGTANNGLNSVTGAVNRGTSNNAYGSSRYDVTSGAYDTTTRSGGSIYTATNNGGLTTRNSTGTNNNGTVSPMSTDRYALMLENARVHDRDGFLLDGENAHYNTF